jgi:hypothetical protein
MTYEEMVQRVNAGKGTTAENQATALLQRLMKANTNLRAAVVTENFSAPIGGTRWAYQQVLGPKPDDDSHDAEAASILVRETGIPDATKAAHVCRGYDAVSAALWLFVGDYVRDILGLTGQEASDEAFRIAGLAQ